MLKHSQDRQINSGCDNKNFRNDSDSKSSDMNESESESEIDLTTTSSPKSFTLVNGCIDFSNNNNNNNNSEK